MRTSLKISNEIFKASFVIVFVLLYFVPQNVKAETIVNDYYIEDLQTWTLAESPYLLNNNLTIADTGTLNVEAGVKIEMTNARKFEIYGKLNILGNENSPVTFTNWGDTTFGFSDRWNGFTFNTGSNGNIDYLILKNSNLSIVNHGGTVLINKSLISNNSSALEMNSGSTTISNTKIDKNDIGIILEGGFLSLSNSIISNSNNYGFLSYNSATGKLAAHNNTFANNKYNAFLDLGIDFEIENNNFSGGTASAWTIGGSIKKNKTLKEGLYHLTGILIEEGGRLDVDPGVTIKGQSGGYIISRAGNLNLNGTKEKPIIFTGITDDEVGGDTNNDGADTTSNSIKTGGIQAEEGGKINISNAVIKNARGEVSIGPFNQIYGSLINRDGEINVENLKIINSYHSAIHHYKGTTTLEKISIDSSDSNFGIVFDHGSFKMRNSSFLSQIGTFAFLSRVGVDLPDARENYWRAVSGPTHPENPSGTGLSIEGNVLFKPFLTAPFGEVGEHSINPVIIIPGIMGSAKKNGELVIDPILHTYDDLIETLDQNGYTRDKDLFTFPYEWRDSNIQSAALLKDKIEEVKNTCAVANLPDTDCTKVDLVAHSMGGLVAREYIQSSQYLNDVDQVIFLGTPHKGSPKAYLQWEAGEFPAGGILDLAVKFFFKAEALRHGYTSLFDYIHDRPISSVQELLPISAYLKDKDTGEMKIYPNKHPQNTFLRNLNTDNNNLFAFGDRITNIVGNVGSSSTIEIIRVGANYSPLWVDGKPDGFDGETDDRGLERGHGDGTVTIQGATIDPSIPNEAIVADHIKIPTIAENRVFNILTNKVSLTNIDSNPGTDYKVLLLQLLSPIDVVITAPDGKKIGKNFTNRQEYNEIPNAFYSGFQTEDEYITILNPLDGEYKIEVQGTGSGGHYGIISSYVTEATSTSAEVSGNILPNQITTFKAELDQNSTTPIEIVGDTLPPTIVITSPQSKDYLRSEKINITATTTDPSGIALFDLKINNQTLNLGSEYDPFYGKLGTTTIFATSTDTLGNLATSSIKFRVVANATSTISDINRSFDLGWIKDKKIRDALIKQTQGIVKIQKKIDTIEERLPNGKKRQVKIERIQIVVDKILAKLFILELDVLLRSKNIKQEAYNIIKEDINWLINN